MLCLAAAASGAVDSPARVRSGESLFSWDPISLPEIPISGRATGSDEMGEAILETISRNPRYEAEEFWTRDRDWAKVFKIGDAAVSPAYFGILHDPTPAHLTIPSSEFDDPTVLGIAIALASLPLIGALLHHRRYSGPAGRLRFYDCGRSGGFMFLRRARAH